MPRAVAGTIVPILLMLAAVGARGQGPDPASGALKPPPIPAAHRFGVSLQGPRYNPDGPIGPTILLDGARDAHRLGFRTLKIAMHAQVVNPDWRFYRLTAAEIASVHALVDIARLDVFRRTLDLPFRTFVITADALGEGNVWSSIAAPGKRGQPRPVDRPLAASAKANIYRQMHDLALHLLVTYRGSGKVFILQDHEMDWKLFPYTDPALEPSEVAFANAMEYMRLRQKAVDDARREAKAEGVYLYNCVEVNLVKKAMTGRRTVANVILPRLDLDLVGYSAWDTSADSDGSFVRAVNYLRAIARPSAAFGRNNVVISEIGAHERSRPDVPQTLRSMLEASAMDVPWVVQWTLYDNEATRVVGGVRVPVYDPVGADCNGLWVRKPDGSFGALFRAYRPYLLADPAGPEPTEAAAYVDRAYRLLLGRAPDPPGAALAARHFEETPWGKERIVADIILSPEYRDRAGGSSAAFVFDAHRALLGRDPGPDPSAVAQLSLEIPAGQARIDYLNALLDSDEARRRFVDWLFRRSVARSPKPPEFAPWLDFFARGGTRKQAYDRFAEARPR